MQEPTNYPSIRYQNSESRIYLNNEDKQGIHIFEARKENWLTYIGYFFKKLSWNWREVTTNIEGKPKTFLIRECHSGLAIFNAKIQDPCHIEVKRKKVEFSIPKKAAAPTPTDLENLQLALSRIDEFTPTAQATILDIDQRVKKNPKTLLFALDKAYLALALVDNPGFTGDVQRVVTFKTDNDQIKNIYKDKKILRKETKHEVEENSGGSVNIGAKYAKTKVTAVDGTVMNAHICIDVAGNAGLPGGRLAQNLTHISEEDLNLKTQEESVVADVICNACKGNPENQLAFYLNVLGGAWGFADLGVQDQTQTKTIQGINYRNINKSSNKISNEHLEYNAAHVVKNCPVSAVKGRNGNKTLDQDNTYEATFIFSYGPNGNPAIGQPTGTMQRTLDAIATNTKIPEAQRKEYFLKCIEESLRAFLDASAQAGATHPIAALLSCGIYSPPEWKTEVNERFPQIYQKLLDERVGPNGEKRGQYFAKPIIPSFPRI